MPGSGERPRNGTDMAKDAIDDAAKAFVSQIFLHTDAGPDQEAAIEAVNLAWDRARHALPAAASCAAASSV